MQKPFIGIIILLCVSLEISMAQQMLSIKPAKPVVCYQSSEAGHDQIPPPERFQRWAQGRSSKLKTANFEVEYINFPADNLAKNAFQFAVDIWETQISSPVTIRVRAQWASLDPGVLGQAIWGSAHANFEGAQHSNTFYPVALAEKIAGRELNPSDAPDVVATFSSTANWYLGTDGNTPAGKTDLVTVVLHEIAHGLGFTDTYDVESTQGSVGLESGDFQIPFVYDLFIENNAGQNLFTQFSSPSSALRSQLISNQLFFNSPLLAVNGDRPKIYAPSPFDGGSSIAHLDEATFTGEGDANKLMTPQISPGESIHDPGDIVLNIFSDIGWVSTRIEHTPLKDTERKDGQPYIVKAKILSDNGYNEDEVVLHYTTDNINFTEVTMTPTGVANEFEGALPGVTTNWGYGYFISVIDVSDRMFTNPGKIQEQNQQSEQGLIVFNIRTDTNAPTITHTPIEYIFDSDNSLTITAEVTDNISVSKARVQYSIQGGNTQESELINLPSSDTYTTTINLPNLNIGDEILYKIIATDNSNNANQSQSPATGFHKIFVTGIKPVQNSYVNNFDLPSTDFIGNSFSITTPAGFSNGAIHSVHPYENGSGPNDESNYIYQLQVPIKINDENPVIKFDEIVLVEPGENGSVFGDPDFYDYVIVEGSKDLGVTWLPFLNGYDSRAVSSWRSHYNSNISDDNSLATGTPLHFRERTIDMLTSEHFEEGDEVLIRFRLFADQAARGWGWAIDNLSIQEPVTGIEQALDKNLKVYPNPANEKIFVEINVPENETTFRIINLQGKEVYRENVTTIENTQRREINISNYPTGLYLIKMQFSDYSVTKKFLKH